VIAAYLGVEEEEVAEGGVNGNAQGRTLRHRF